MARLKVDDMSGVLMSVVQLELVNAQEPGLLFRLPQFLSIYGVILLKPLFINLLDGVLPKSGNRCHPLVVQALGKKVTSVVVQGNRYPVSLSLERYALAFGCVAFGTAKLIMLNAEISESATHGHVPEMSIQFLVAVHFAFALTADHFLFRNLKLALEPPDLPFGL
jgi:hypothetical protein